MDFNRFTGIDNKWLKTHFVRIIHIFLVISIVSGLALKFLISQSISLTSDHAYGLATREIFVNQNFFLINFYYPQVGPYYFTDIYTFQLVPQIVSNFSPFALKFVGFITFCLVILAFSFLIWKISQNLTCSLIFAALVANLTPLSYYHYAQIYHVGAIFFIGILMILLIRFPNTKIHILVISLIILLLIVISDSLIIIWFVLSGLLYYAYSYYISKIDWRNLTKIGIKKIDITGLWFVIVSVIAVLWANSLIKNIRYLTSYLAPLSTVGPGTALQQAVMFCKNIILLYNSTIYGFFFSEGNLNILDYLTLIAAIALALYSIFLLRENINNKLIIFCLCSLITGILVFSVTNVTPEVRYLLFYGIILFVSISVMYKKDDRIFLSLVLCVLIFNGASNFAYVQTMDNTPNQHEYDLIAFLEANNLHYGMADFWDSNIISYISNGTVIIRAVVPSGDTLFPFKWLSAESWYSNDEAKKFNFILIRNSTPLERPFLNHGNIQPYLEAHPPDTVLYWQDYVVYIYNPEQNS
jgi:hypothetical protein